MWVAKGVSGGVDGSPRQCGLLVLESMQVVGDKQLQDGRGLFACPTGFVLTAAANIKVCVGCSDQTAAPWPEPSVLKLTSMGFEHRSQQ